MNSLLRRISIDPNVCFGKPCIKGTRIWVSLLLDYLANGMNFEEILIEYQHLEVDDIKAAIAYGAEMARERYVEIPITEASNSSKNSGYSDYRVVGIQEYPPSTFLIGVVVPIP